MTFSANYISLQHLLTLRREESVAFSENSPFPHARTQNARFEDIVDFSFRAKCHRRHMTKRLMMPPFYRKWYRYNLRLLESDIMIIMHALPAAARDILISAQDGDAEERRHEAVFVYFYFLSSRAATAQILMPRFQRDRF